MSDLWKNPRTVAVVHNWPMGGPNRGTAEFVVEQNERGERVKRSTGGKWRPTIYHRRMCIVEGVEDGKTYLLGEIGFLYYETNLREMVCIEGTLKGREYYHSPDPAYDEIKRHLDATHPDSPDSAEIG
jgi:hypothetical protein